LAVPRKSLPGVWRVEHFPGEADAGSPLENATGQQQLLLHDPIQPDRIVL